MWEKICFRVRVMTLGRRRRNNVPQIVSFLIAAGFGTSNSPINLASFKIIINKTKLNDSIIPNYSFDLLSYHCTDTYEICLLSFILLPLYVIFSRPGTDSSIGALVSNWENHSFAAKHLDPSIRMPIQSTNPTALSNLCASFAMWSVRIWMGDGRQWETTANTMPALGKD